LILKWEGKTAMSDSKMNSTGKTETRTGNIPVEIWHELLQIAGRQIDPKTAEVDSEWCQMVDPNGIYSDSPPEGGCIGRLDFARAPGTELWILFDDLPAATCEALRKRARDSDPEDEWPF
jgi:hypothetical protein